MAGKRKKADSETSSTKSKKKKTTSDSDLLEVDSIAPDFEVKDQDGETVKLSEIKKTVVLFFYPKDNTPGCKKENIAFSKISEKFEKNDIKLLGVSTDSVKSHKSFCEKAALKHTLISDADRDILEKYNAQSKRAGSKSARRITYVIGKDMKIVKVYGSVKPETHAKEVFEDLVGKTESEDESEEEEDSDEE